MAALCAARTAGNSSLGHGLSFKGMASVVVVEGMIWLETLAISAPRGVGRMWYSGELGSVDCEGWVLGECLVFVACRYAEGVKHS